MLIFVELLSDHEAKEKEGAQDRKENTKGSKHRTVPDRLAKIAENRKRGRPAPVVETKV